MKPENEAKSPRTLMYSRILSAPPAAAYAAWTEPAQLRQWWEEPGKFHLTHCEADLRPGGAFRRTMRGENGVDYVVEGIYHELDKPTRLVYTESCGPVGETQESWRVTVHFEEIDAGTRVTIRADFDWNLDDAWRTGWTEGQREVLDRLATFLS